MCQLIFQHCEGFFLCGTPNKRHILLCKLVERRSNGAEISHKTPIETSEAKETPHLCDRFGLRPTLNSFNLGFINFNSLWSNKHSQEKILGRCKWCTSQGYQTNVYHVEQ